LDKDTNGVYDNQKDHKKSNPDDVTIVFIFLRSTSELDSGSITTIGPPSKPPGTTIDFRDIRPSTPFPADGRGLLPPDCRPPLAPFNVVLTTPFTDTRSPAIWKVLCDQLRCHIAGCAVNEAIS
jgi:hypothetical protein